MSADNGRAGRRAAPIRRSRRGLTATESEQLEWAFDRLEHPSLAARLSDYVGEPIEGLGKLLNTIKIVQGRLNTTLQIEGILQV